MAFALLHGLSRTLIMRDAEDGLAISYRVTVTRLTQSAFAMQCVALRAALAAALAALRTTLVL